MVALSPSFSQEITGSVALNTTHHMPRDQMMSSTLLHTSTSHALLSPLMSHQVSTTF